jgi:hypothetical protein
MYHDYIMIDKQGLLSKEQPTIRTQISLTPLLKKAIEAKRRLTGESLSGYLRKAAVLRLLVEEEEKTELKRLAKAVIGSVDLREHPEWENKRKIQKWIRKIREDWK